jgi:Transposase
VPYNIAGIDVHKKMLHVVFSDVEVDGEYQFVRRKFDTSPSQLRTLANWLLEQKVEQVAMESTAQYWKPVWETLERDWKPVCETREGAKPESGTLHLAQALSNRGRPGRKKDFRDAERRRPCWKKPTSSYPAWSLICWEPVHGACSQP